MIATMIQMHGACPEGADDSDLYTSYHVFCCTLLGASTMRPFWCRSLTVLATSCHRALQTIHSKVESLSVKIRRVEDVRANFEAYIIKTLACVRLVLKLQKK
jgi:hypothetical protein